LEHEELQEAREASRKAQNSARNAFWISVGALLVTSAAVITAVFVQPDITIDPSQINDFKEFIGEQFSGSQ